MSIKIEDHEDPMAILNTYNIPVEFYRVHVEFMIHIYNNDVFSSNVYSILEDNPKYIHNWISNSVIAYLITSKASKNEIT